MQKNDRWGLGPIEIYNSDTKFAVLHAKTTDEGWHPLRQVILMLRTLFCMHKSTDEGWDPYRCVILVMMSLFWMHNTTDEGWDP